MTSDLATLWISSKFCTSKRFLDDWFQVDMAYQACGVECEVASETGDFGISMQGIKKLASQVT